MSTSDLFTADYPHGTPEGFDDGCRGGSCPGADQWGLSCKRAKQLSRSDYQYQKLAGQGLTPAAIADELGLVPTGAATKPVTKRAPKPKPADHAAAKAARGYTEELAPAVITQINDSAAELIAALPAETPAISVATTPTPKEIRAWAVERGYEVKPMGKLPQHIIDHYWETHDVGTHAEADTNAHQVDTIGPEVDTEAPESFTIIPEPAGPRPEWSHVTLTEDLARAQTDRDALAEELEETQGALTRARGLAARLEEELARDQAAHAAEISDLHLQLTDNHNDHRQRILQLEEALALAELTGIDTDREHQELVTRLRTERDDAQSHAREIAAGIVLETGQTIALLTSALEFTIRHWAIERDRNQRHDEQLEAFRQEYEAARLGSPTILQPLTITKLAEQLDGQLTPTPATPNDDGTPSEGMAARIRRGWGLTR